jgi:phospholipid/cholesterol/gamma-HCH transport system substrate-binding protein
VDDVELSDSNRIMVTFTAARDVPVNVSTRAAIRYQNIVGDRYLELSKGSGSSEILPRGDVIPLSRTSPALDLDELYNGFTPLLEGLNPDQVNHLSSALIGAFQGEGPSLTELLSSVGSLTGTLADRDRTIGAMIDNLRIALATTGARAPELADLIDQLQRLTSGFAADRQQVGSAVARIGDLTGTVADLLAQARPDLQGDIRQVDRLASLINADQHTVNTDLQRLPEAYRQLQRMASYGSFFDFYICAVQLRTVGPDGQPLTTPFITSGVSRCR